MEGNYYQISYKGQLVSGAELVQVRNNLQQLFKATDAVMDKLMSGKSVIIKKAISQQKATAFQKAMHKAGAIAQVSMMAVEENIELAAPPKSEDELEQEQSKKRLIEDDLPPPPPIAPKQARANFLSEPDAPEEDDADLAPPPSVEITESKDPHGIPDPDQWQTEPVGTRLSKAKKAHKKPPPSTDHIDLAPPKSDVGQAKRQIQAVTPDISGLDLSEVGERLSEEVKKEKLNIDLSQFELAEVGSDMGQEVEYKEIVNPDISQLSMAEQEGDIPTLKKDKTPLNPEISHLSLE